MRFRDEEIDLDGAVGSSERQSASGRLDPATGTLIVDAEVVGAERRTARYEVCEETQYWPWWLSLGLTAGAAQITSFGLMIDGGLPSHEGGVGILLFLASIPPAATAMGLGVADGREFPTCRIAEELFPPGPADDRVSGAAFFVRVDRADGRTMQRTFPAQAAEIALPLEPDLFLCPPDCPATTARIAGEPPATLRLERVAVTVALPDPELFGTEAPNAAFSVDVPLMPEGWSEPPVPPPEDPSPALDP